jgi:hypothetical protein
MLSSGWAIQRLAEGAPCYRLHPTSLGNRLQAVAQGGRRAGGAQGLVVAGGEGDWEARPRPALPRAVRVGGGDVYACEQKTRNDGNLEWR